MATAFSVDEVELATSPYETTSQIDFLREMTQSPIEACSGVSTPVLKTATSNQFFEAVGMAYDLHFPLVLSPDSIWITITQGLANHINKNAEALRKRFVSHEGKEMIMIHRDAFIMGSPENDWAGCFDEFSSEIKKRIGPENHAMIVADFSTTGPIEKAASEVVLMDAMQSYFEYGVMTCCGIPHITLEGTVEDWERMRAKVNAWDGLGLDFWLPSLKRVLDEFVNAAKGNPNPRWWSSIYKKSGGSGGPYISGWITWLLPYTKDYRNNLHQNSMIGDETERHFGGLTDSSFPSSLSKVPFTWFYYGKEFAYEFLAGVTGISQAGDATPTTPADPNKAKANELKARLSKKWAVYSDPIKTGAAKTSIVVKDGEIPNLAVRPVIGWAVRPKPDPAARKKQCWEELLT